MNQWKHKRWFFGAKEINVTICPYCYTSYNDKDINFTKVPFIYCPTCGKQIIIQDKELKDGEI